MSDEFRHESFWKQFVMLCRKHKVTWLQVDSMWIDGEHYRATYDFEPEAESLDLTRSLKTLEIDCAKWGS